MFKNQVQISKTYTVVVTAPDDVETTEVPKPPIIEAVVVVAKENPVLTALAAVDLGALSDEPKFKPTPAKPVADVVVVVEAHVGKTVAPKAKMLKIIK